MPYLQGAAQIKSSSLIEAQVAQHDFIEEVTEPDESEKMSNASQSHKSKSQNNLEVVESVNMESKSSANENLA